MSEETPDPIAASAGAWAWARWLAGMVVLIGISIAVVLLVVPGRKKMEPHAPTPVQAPYAARTSLHEVRPPSVAGQFYPGEAQELYREVERMMTNSPGVGRKGARAILVPHAGYVYSGEVAATSFREVDPGFRRVFLLAANHNGAADFAGVSMPKVSHYAIPGVDIPLAAVVDELAKDSLFTHEPAAHTMHMIELELPFLHYLRGRPAQPDFVIVPMILGRMDRAQVERLAQILAGYADAHTLFVFSVDLSHYHPDAQARQLDQFTVQAVLSGDADNLERATADGNHVLLTLVNLAQRQRWEPDFLVYKNSGDVSGDRERVVGYASVIFGEPLALSADAQREILAYARRVVETYVREGKTVQAEPDLLARHPILRLPRGVFVTLKKENKLRGCIGDLVSNEPLHAGIQKCGINAAAKDPRFDPVNPGELKDLTLSISILNFPRKVEAAQPADYAQTLRPGKDGVILLLQGRSSTFLPSVWEEIPDPEEFLARLCLKQGAAAQSWREPGAVLFRYSALEVKETE